MTMKRAVHHIPVGEPPKDCRTVSQWLAWREAENLRMLAELKDWIYAVAEAEMRRQLGAQDH